MANKVGVNIILASTFDGGIGFQNRLPWDIPSELKKFKDITTNTQDPKKINALIMGRRTWESIGKPLKNRLNIVLTTNRNYKVDYPEVRVINHMYNAVFFCYDSDDIEQIFIIGGENIYRNALYNNFYFDVDKIIWSVPFYQKYFIDTYVDVRVIYEKYDIKKDETYSRESEDRLFASYICTLKKQILK